jgi:hypothetical protein
MTEGTFKVATARDIRAKLRAEVEAQLKAKEKSALAVGRAIEKQTKASGALATAERAVADAVRDAKEVLTLEELATINDIKAAELRALLNRHPKATAA